MSEPERLVRFTLLGQEFQFYTAAGEREVDAILSLVREEVEGSGGARRGNLPAGKLAIMACLNVASKYVLLEQEFERYKADNATRVAQLSEEIRSTLATD
ncbi:MAG: cell division protein ZapA [Desulfopila sp.]